MVKKLLIVGLFLLIVIGAVWYYNSQKTVECWWGVMYPTLSFVAIEDEEVETQENKTSHISSLNTTYVGRKMNTTDVEEPIKFKFALTEFFNKYFK